jgi:NTE family protein
MHPGIARSTLLCALLACASTALTQQQQPTGPVKEDQNAPAPKTLNTPLRPRIGVALDGGGALGLAHVGVLRWMEEHHIPIEAVAGTSMGGLVGAVYASGDSPDQIDAFVKTIRWDKVLADTIPYEDLSFRRKQDSKEFPATVLLTWQKGIKAREGYNSGQQVQLLIDQIALPYSQTTNFDDLPVPFRCVATDLVTARQKDFGSGDLSTALRATMALPGIFSPVRRDGTVYADGGLVDNLPVDVAKQMGADVVIAIYLQTKPLDPKEKLSPITTLAHSISVMIAANELRNMQAADVLISVPLSDYTATDYGDSEKIIAVGYAAAEAKATVLEKFSVDDAEWQRYINWRNSRRKTVPVPQFVAVKGVKGPLADQVTRALANDLHKPIQPADLGRQLMALTGDGRLGDVNYGLTDRNGQPGLLIRAQDKPFGSIQIRPLFAIDGWNYEDITLDAGARITDFDLGGAGAELRTDLYAGSELGVHMEYYRPLTAYGRFFVAPNGVADNSPLYLFSEKDLLAIYRQRTLGGGLDIGFAINKDSEVRLGYLASHLKLSPEVGDKALYPTEDGRQGTSRFRYVFNGVNDPIIPTRGSSILVRTEWWDARPYAGTQFPLAEVQLKHFFPVNEKSSIYLFGSAGSTLWKDPGGLPVFSLGGSLRLPAYYQNELLTNQYYLFQSGYEYQLAELPALIGGKIMLIGGVDIAKAYDLPDASHHPSDAVAGMVINTFLGPLLVGGSVGDSGHRKLFFQFGKTLFSSAP